MDNSTYNNLLIVLAILALVVLTFVLWLAIVVVRWALGQYRTRKAAKPVDYSTKEADDMQDQGW